MLKTNIVLYILSRNKNNLEYYILSTSKDSVIHPKSEIIANHTLKDNCYDLYKKYINLDKNLLDFRILDIKIIDEIDIICFCLIPFNFPIKDSYLIPIKQDEISSSYLQKIINIT